MAPALVDREPHHIARCRTFFTAMFILITFLENFKHIKKNILLTMCISLINFYFLLAKLIKIIDNVAQYTALSMDRMVVIYKRYGG
jgi:hypothetical protein